ncbi:MAG: AbrB/MazE/SpoVT family DNA-binding domain-containing protein [Akkermansiaceae bacterium]
MIKTITKIGNSRGIILDAALLELANLKEGDRVNITVHGGGSITMVPEKPRIDDETFDSTLNEVLEDYSSTLKKLS